MNIVTEKWCSDRQGKWPDQLSKKVHSRSSCRKGSWIGTEIFKFLTAALIDLNTSRTYRLQAGIARLNDSAFPAKRCKLLTGAKDDHKSLSRNALNFSFLSSGTKMACNTESAMQPRNLTKVSGCRELFARLTKYPAEMRRNNKIRAAACASSRQGWQTTRPDRKSWPTCLSSIYCETGKPKDRVVLLTTGPTLWYK